MVSEFDDVSTSRPPRDLTGILRNEQPTTSSTFSSSAANHSSSRFDLPHPRTSINRTGTSAPTTAALGLLHSTVLPSLSLHLPLAAGTYALARSTDRAELKDHLWPAAPLLNAWWSAVGERVVAHGVPLHAAWAALTYDQKLLLGGVTAWALRLLGRIVQRSSGRAAGRDDPRYEAAREREGERRFWRRMAGVMALEALVQSLVAVPFTLPFRESGQAWLDAPTARGIRTAAVGLFGAGMALEVVADAQVEAHKAAGSGGLKRDGVWGIVRHPNYLGDALTHLSFGLLASLRHPLAIIGPLANYAFLRYVGGDRENEASQEERYARGDGEKHRQLREWKSEKNRFWPGIAELGNGWTWIVVGTGAATVLLERMVGQALGAQRRVDVDWTRGYSEMMPIEH